MKLRAKRAIWGGSEERVSKERRRLLEAFGYQWNKESRTWGNNEAGRALSEETVMAWSLDELRAWLTKGAGPTHET